MENNHRLNDLAEICFLNFLNIKSPRSRFDLRLVSDGLYVPTAFASTSCLNANLLFNSFVTVSLCIPWLASYSQRSTYLCIPSAGMKGVLYQCLLPLWKRETNRNVHWHTPMVSYLTQLWNYLPLITVTLRDIGVSTHTCPSWRARGSTELAHDKGSLCFPTPTHPFV